MKTLATLFSLIIATAAFANNNPITSTNSLNATVNTGAVVLNFNANGSTRFEIERAFYSNEFSTIQTISLPFAGVNQLKVQDNADELAGRSIAYYRIKIIGNDGRISYSNISTVVLKATDNKAAQKITRVNFSSPQQGSATLTLKTLTGKTVSTLNTLVNQGSNSVELTHLTSLAQGVYSAVVTVNGVVVDTQKVIAE